MSYKFVAVAAIATAFLGVSATASAQGHRGQLRLWEQRLHTLEARQQYDLAHHEGRKAQRLQPKIDRARDEIRRIKHM